MTATLTVNIPQVDEKSYNIHVETTPVADLITKLNQLTKDRKRLIVISQKVYKLYKKIFKFDKNEIFVLKDGECEKNIKNYTKIVQKAFDLGLSRKDVIIAIGGGVVGDMTGFVAATYMRGIEFIQIPTTLLAFVDSSVGGKTAIDLPFAKNYIGAFYQPSVVFINLNFLKTLDKRQMLSGLGEVIKYGFIELNCQAEKKYLLLELLAIAVDKILAKDFDMLERIIKICLEFKISVVTKDEKESGLRKILNFGHTFGHALETLTKYKKYTHGEAVVYGIMFAFKYALSQKMINKTYYNFAFELFRKYGYSDITVPKCKFNKIIDIMKYDKKSYSGTIVMLLPDKKASVTEKEIKNTTEFEF